MSDDRDTLGTLISRAAACRCRTGGAPPSGSSELADGPRAARRDPDDYWEWVAEQQRWLDAVDDRAHRRAAATSATSTGGRINVADNCVDRWAEDPATADRAADRVGGRAGRHPHGDLRRARRRGRPAGRRPGRARASGKGDVVGDLHAEPRRGVHRDPRLQPDRRDLHGAVLRLRRGRRRLAAAGRAGEGRRRRRRDLPARQAGRRCWRRCAPPGRRTPTVRATSSWSTAPGRGVPLSERRARLRRRCSPSTPRAPPTVPLDPNEPAFLIFTSGTESKPKGVVHSVGGFLLGTWANAHWQAGHDDGDVYWVAADVGWLTFPIQAVDRRARLRHRRSPATRARWTPRRTARFYEICERHDVTKVLCAPTVLRMLRKFGDDLAAAHPLPRLKLITVQGEPLDGETFTWATEHVRRARSSTPTGRPRPARRGPTRCTGVDDLKAGSVGTPVPGHAFEIVDDDGAAGAAGRQGQPRADPRRSRRSRRTVWDDHERYLDDVLLALPRRATPPTTRPSSTTTGTCGCSGRADDVINVAAHRISTMEIEAVVGTPPARRRGRRRRGARTRRRARCRSRS